jgi:hypothetical protein
MNKVIQKLKKYDVEIIMIAAIFVWSYAIMINLNK